MRIRPERPDERHAVENLIREAFWNIYRPGCTEHYILHKLRGDPCFEPRLSFLAEADGHIAGYIAAARGTLTRPDGTQTEQLLFGPLGVLPAFQRRGLGAALMNYTLAAAPRLGYRSAVLSGSPEYYSRFGFVQAGKYGVRPAGMDEDPWWFLMKVFNGCVGENSGGVYADPPVYSVSDADVEKFDAQFPTKKKERRPGQLF
jgi:putative acetyltransferase